MRTMTRVVFSFLLLFLLAGAVSASEQSPFSADELQRCCADMPEFMKYLESKGVTADSPDAPSSLKQLASNQLAIDWLDDKGWEAERWAYVLDHITRGYMALKMRAQSPQLEQMKQAANSPGMSPEMKAQMEEALKQMMAAQNPEGIAPEEMALIEANMSAIDAMYEGMK